MEPAEIITDAMVEKAMAAWDGEPDPGPFTAMRAALESVAPLFAEQFAKVADERADQAASICRESASDNMRHTYQAREGEARQIADAIRAKGAARD